MASFQTFKLPRASRYFVTVCIFVAGLHVSQLNAQPNALTITQSVQPSFHIEPVVKRLQGRRGEVIPFSFEMTSTGKAMEVSVTPVNLRQETSGIILHDESSPPQSQLRLTSPTSFSLAPGESVTIQGEVTVPIAKTNLLTYGILVKDRGQVTNPNQKADDGSQTRAGVKFITQYVLRVEIETGVQDSEELKRIEFLEGHVHAVRGMPVARVVVDNPTDFAVECQVLGSISAPTSKKGKPFPLSMPSRANLPGEEKHLVRVMPHSRIRVETPLESVLMAGDQSLRISMSNGRRTLVEQVFDFSVQTGDFPAMETQIAFLGKQFSVQPAQVQLGRLGGMTRTCNIKFANNAQEDEHVYLRLRDLRGEELVGAKLSNEELEVGSGRVKTIRLMMGDLEKSLPTQYGFVEVHRDADAQSAACGRIPLIINNGSEDLPELQLEDMQLTADQTIELIATNRGRGFVPLHGALRLTNEEGHACEMADGYGKWLAPQETRRLKFKPESKLPSGNYQLSLKVYTRGEQPDMQKTLEIKL